MLVLSRKVDEMIDLYDGNVKIATVMLVDARNGKARIGIDAGAGVKIVRRELPQPSPRQTSPAPAPS